MSTPNGNVPGEQGGRGESSRETLKRGRRESLNFLLLSLSGGYFIHYRKKRKNVNSERRSNGPAQPISPRKKIKGNPLCPRCVILFSCLALAVIAPPAPISQFFGEINSSHGGQSPVYGAKPLPAAPLRWPRYLFCDPAP